MNQPLDAQIGEALALVIDGNTGTRRALANMLRDFGEISRKCNEWSMPLMVMIYPRGKDIKDAYDVELVKKCARTATTDSA